MKAFRDEILRELVNRLRFQDDLKRYPEILDEDVSDPIFIIGLPRSGTTKTFRMMAADPGLLKATMWQLINPAPFPDAVPGQPDPRIAKAYQDEQVLGDHADVRAGHYYAAEEFNEDTWLYGPTFNDDYWRPGRTPSPAFQAWTRTRAKPSDMDNYRYVRSLTQYLQWQMGGRRGRRWVVKNTGHVGHLDEVLELYPKATFVHIHRQPKDFVASVAKLSSAFARLRYANIDPLFFGRFHLERSKYLLGKYMRDRDRLGLNDRILDVQYDQIRNDPMPAIREIYRRADLVLAPEAELAMLQWERENEQGKHGAHVYSLEQFGLNEQAIDDALGAYTERFLPESKS